MLGVLVEDGAGHHRLSESLSLIWEGLRLRFSPSSAHLRPLVPAVRFGALGWFGFGAGFHLLRERAFVASLSGHTVWSWHLVVAGAALLVVPLFRGMVARLILVAGAVALLTMEPFGFADRVEFALRYLLVPAVAVLWVDAHRLRWVAPTAGLFGATSSWLLWTGGTPGVYRYLGAFRIGGLLIMATVGIAVGAIIFRRFAAALWVPAAHLVLLLFGVTAASTAAALGVLAALVMLASRRRWQLVPRT
jgi:hypothetical protein